MASKMLSNLIMLCVFFLLSMAADQPPTSVPSFNCRDRSNHLRQDGGLCFEIPPWQHQPVELEQHITRLKARWGAVVEQHRRTSHLALANSEISRYMDTVLAPFLDTYHRNIQNAYQQLTSKILRRIKEEINQAVKKKLQVYSELMALANDLNVPEMCDEERRQTRTLASNHVAMIYACTEDARSSIAKMGKYAEDMIAITRSHMQGTLNNVARSLEENGQPAKTMKKENITACLKDLSRSAVQLGYELDLSLTNARRHNEQSCEKLSGCSAKARRRTEDVVTDLKDQMYQCVYA